MYPRNQQISGIENKVYRFVKTHQLISPGEHILLGVSGGPDSIAMVHILLKLQKILGVSKYSVLHVNHGIRPESEEEEQFVVRSMKEAGIDEVVVEKFDVPSISRQMGVSIEMGARFCRHEALERTRERLHADKIALAHHGNDQAEELLLRLFRGSSLEGFEGMRPLEKNRRIIRPLLCLSKQEILSYLEDNGLSCVEDSSNSMPCFQRNRVRLELIPLVEDIFKRPVVRLLNRFTDIAAQENDYWEKEITKSWEEICVEETKGKISIDVRKFADLHPALQRRIVRHIFARLRSSSYGVFFGHVEAVRRLMLESQSGRRMKIAGVEIIREGFRNTFFVEATGSHRTDRNFPDNDSPHLATREKIPIPGKRSVVLTEGMYLVIETQIHLNNGRLIELAHNERNLIAMMDYQALKKPLYVRTWRPGDRFQPLGMKGHTKKLHDFFIDLKIPKSLRNSIPLIVDGEKICWVIGYRLDERVKVTPDTREILEVRVSIFKPAVEENLPSSS